MRRFTLLILFLLTALLSKAQYVTIDSTFGKFLQSDYPQCMKSGSNTQLDTVVASGIKGQMYCYMRGVKDISGIVYFKNLDSLYCLGSFGNNLTSLPDLPKNLTYLSCQHNNITKLPASLPSKLRFLDCTFNPLTLTDLPVLPDGLLTLACRNFGGNMPTLPATLTYLDCTGCTCLPHLPNGLKYLYVNIGNDYSNVMCIPNRPDSLIGWTRQPLPIPICDSTSNCYIKTTAVSPCMDDDGFKVFPNPANGFLQVEFARTNPAIYWLTLYNAVGQSVYEDQAFTPGTQIDLTGLPKGIYLLRLSHGAGVYERKVILE